MVVDWKVLWMEENTWGKIDDIRLPRSYSGNCDSKEMRMRGRIGMYFLQVTHWMVWAALLL